MTADLDDAQAQTDAVEGSERPRSVLVTVLVAVIAIALVVAAVAVGYSWGNRGDDSSVPSNSSVDVGFARDMITHHEQAVLMAGYERDTTSDSALHTLA